MSNTETRDVWLGTLAAFPMKVHTMQHTKKKTTTRKDDYQLETFGQDGRKK